MNQQLLLDNIRDVLIRLEETILFAVIERAQFKQNPVIYERGAFPDISESESLVGYLLHETERIHARMRRYTSPGEYPYFDDLPDPVLPELRYDENPLYKHTVNLNAKIRVMYETGVVPAVCSKGDDRQYGSCAVCDVACLQAFSKRIHYGMFVAESKYRQSPGRFDALIDVGDKESIGREITDSDVESMVLDRVGRKADKYLQDINACSSQKTVAPETIVEIYRGGIIPLTKQVEIEYLLRRHQA